MFTSTWVVVSASRLRLLLVAWLPDMPTSVAYLVMPLLIVSESPEPAMASANQQVGHNREER